MITDLNLRLSGTTGTAVAAPVPQSLAISSGTVSTNVVDTLDKFNVSDGDDLEVHFGVVTTAGASSAAVNITLDIAVYAVPFSGATGSAGSIGSVSNADGSGTPATLFTKAAHGLVNGTRVTLTAITGISASTAYYIRNATTDTFELSATPTGAIVTYTNAATSTITVTWYGEHLGNLIVPYERLIAGTNFTMCLSPNHMLAPVHRYLIAVYTPSAALNAGEIFADVVYNTSDNRKYYPNGFTIQ